MATRAASGGRPAAAHCSRNSAASSGGASTPVEIVGMAIGHPSVTARSTDDGELAESQIGGCGCCTGRGWTVTASSGGRSRPDHVTASAVQSRRSRSTASASSSSESSHDWPNWR